MITREIAVAAGGSWGRVTFYHRTLRNSRGERVECRTNGKCKVWKTRPDDFQLPVKYGLRDCFYITPHNAGDWLTAEQVALADKEEARSKKG